MFSQKQQFVVKNVFLMDLFITNTVFSHFTRCWLMDWSHIGYCDAFISLILTAPIHCRGSIGEQVM